MRKRQLLIKAGLLLAAVCGTSTPTLAQSSDFGVWTDVGVTKKFNKHWSLEAEAGLRTRDNSKETDRWSLGVSGAYKFNSYVKLSAGYDLLYDHREKKETFHKDGTTNKLTPAYWWPRHRFYADVTGSYSLGRLGLSLRERYQYTYRAKAKNKKYDADDDEWEDVKSKSSNLLRSRLEVDYNIRKCPLTPFASVELFHGEGGLQKTRYTVGADYNFNKRHAVKLYYRYQTVNDNDDDEPDCHVLGLGYSYKF